MVLGAGCALGLIIPPLLVLWPATIDNPAEQGRLFWAAVLVFVAAVILYFVGTPLFVAKRSVIPLIVAGVAAVMVLQVVWNERFRELAGVQYRSRHEIFRPAFRTFYAPTYGRSIAEKGGADMTRWSFACSAAALAVLWSCWAVAAATARSLRTRWRWRSWAVLLGFQCLLILAFAASERPKGGGEEGRFMSTRVGSYGTFRQDLASFKDVPDVLRTYTPKMPWLRWLGQHYPPGILILLRIEEVLGVPNLTKWLAVLMLVVATVPVHGLSLELGLDEAAAKAAALLFASTSGVLIYATVHATAMLVLPAGVCLWMLARALRTGRLWPGFVLGLAFDSYLFFSCSVSVLGLLMAIMVLAGLRNGSFVLRDVLKTVAVAGGTTVGLYAGVWLVSGFNMAACFAAAIEGHHRQQGGSQFTSPIAWMFRSTGNLIAYAVSVPMLLTLACGAAWSARRHAPPPRAR